MTDTPNDPREPRRDTSVGNRSEGSDRRQLRDELNHERREFKPVIAQVGEAA